MDRHIQYAVLCLSALVLGCSSNETSTSQASAVVSYVYEGQALVIANGYLPMYSPEEKLWWGNTGWELYERGYEEMPRHLYIISEERYFMMLAEWAEHHNTYYCIIPKSVIEQNDTTVVNVLQAYMGLFGIVEYAKNRVDDRFIMLVYSGGDGEAYRAKMEANGIVDINKYEGRQDIHHGK